MNKNNKILNLEELKLIKKKLKNRKIVLCHGVFDLLHVGHVNYFKAAKKLGDILIVSITNDEFVDKGPGRPAFKINDRINFLNEITSIDYLFTNSELTSEKVILNLRPDFYCKGSDYSKTNISSDLKLKKELEALKKVKGKFKIIKQPSYSSSRYINMQGMQNFDQNCRSYIDSIKKKFKSEDITEIIDKIKNKKVLIIGETIVDKYITTEAIGKSGKEPIMVVKPLDEIKFIGGIGYIANLCSSFINNIKIISFLGEINSEKKFIINNLEKNINFKLLEKKKSPTISKVRYLDAYKKTKILGVYNLNDDSISKAEEEKFIKAIKENINKYDIIIVADYGHGLITKKVRDFLLKYNKKIYLNTQINSFNRGYHTVFKYKKVNTLIINESELRYELRDKNSSIKDLVKKLSKKLSAKQIIITRGANGSTFVDLSKNISIDCPAFNNTNVDTVGAGDTFFTIFSLMLSSKIDARVSLLIASIAASFSIDQLNKKITFSKKILTKHLSHMFK
jgi:rfaE bifunctional protein kinase chain/domain/rfaE bifunctional protein nucleotidyltransferase chain/domain